MSCVQYLMYIIMYLTSYVSCVKVTIFKATHRKCNEYGALPTPHLLVTFTQSCSSVCLTKIANMYNRPIIYILFVPKIKQCICIFFTKNMYIYIITKIYIYHLFVLKTIYNDLQSVLLLALYKLIAIGIDMYSNLLLLVLIQPPGWPEHPIIEHTQRQYWCGHIVFFASLHPSVLQ